MLGIFVLSQAFAAFLIVWKQGFLWLLLNSPNRELRVTDIVFSRSLFFTAKILVFQ